MVASTITRRPVAATGDLDAVAEPRPGPHAEEAGTSPGRRTGPRARRPARRSSSASSRSRYGRHVSRSSGVGLFAGGAQRTGAVIQTPVELEAVVGRIELRLVGEAGAVQGGVEPVARAVAGEHAPGAVGPVGGGREPDDARPARRDRRTRDRPAPVLLVPERGPLLGRDLLAPRHQARARAAARPRRRPGSGTDPSPIAWPTAWPRPARPSHDEADQARAPAHRSPRSCSWSATGRRPRRARAPRPGQRPAPRRRGPRPGRGGRRADQGPARRPDRSQGRGRRHRRLRLAARAHPGDGRPDRQGPRPADPHPTGACSSATSASGRARSSRSSTSCPSGRRCSATRAASASPAASRSPRCRPASSTP